MNGARCDLHILGAAAALGSPCRPCREAAGVAGHLLRQHPKLRPCRCRWYPPIVAPEYGDIGRAAIALHRRIAVQTRVLTAGSHAFVFVSGDHSQAMGVWRGVVEGLPPRKRLGLLWIDAHLDAHTMRTSPSRNLHGMPVAGMLGVDDEPLRALCGGRALFQPDQLCLVGGRSFEPEERELLAASSVRSLDMHSIRCRGILTVLHDAWRYLAARCDVIGISLDLDAVDPADAPGVAVPAGGGIAGTQLLQALAALPRPLALELAEFNPQADIEHRTLDLMAGVIARAFYEKTSPYRSRGSWGRATRSISVPNPRSRTRSYRSRNVL